MKQRFIRQLISKMSTGKPKIVANKYFTSNTAKDVWSLTNEAAAQAANNSNNQGREL